MLTIWDDAGSRLCDGLRRRDWLRLGGLSALGLTTAAASTPRPAQAAPKEVQFTPGFGQAKHCILVGFIGGTPQHETWDPKPEAPVEIRGPLGWIDSSIPGLKVGELMPKIARIAHKCAVLRAMVTNDNAHSSSGYYMFTGQPHQPMNMENARPQAPNNWPNFGSLLKSVVPHKPGLPDVVVLPEHLWNDGNIPWPGQDGGFLGRAADPWLLTCDPSQASFKIPALSLPEEIPQLRFDRRLSLLSQVGQHLEQLDREASVARYRLDTEQALDLLRTPKVRDAFDLSKESATVRDRYTHTRFGQSVLLARRLVEAGVGHVQVNWTRMPEYPNQGGWDTHSKNVESLKKPLMPMADACFSSLIEELDERGLLDETLVVWFTEFGRTPKFNGNGGRDHWGPVFSIALAGGGIKGGVVHGVSDKLAAYPVSGVVRPQDLHATLFHCLGYDPETLIHDTLGRPIPLSRGEVVKQIL